MTITVKLDLNRPYQIAAFGDFCKACAEGAEQWDKDHPPTDWAGLLGGINRDGNSAWRHVGPPNADAVERADATYTPEAELPTEAQDAKVETKPAETAPQRERGKPVPPWAAPQRERGKPAPGRSRRTKEEIAEDEAAEKAEAAAKGNISTSPEDRQDPDNPPVDDEATQAQDKADEKAEVEANRDQAKPLSVEDVKATVNGYVKKFGLAATQEDGPRIFVEALGNPPAGEPYWKMSILPDDQDKLAKVIETWEMAIELNPLKREPVKAA